jgi:hypothetical protein
MQVDDDIKDYDLLTINVDNKSNMGTINMNDVLTTDSVILKGYHFRSNYVANVQGAQEYIEGVLSVSIPWLSPSTLSPRGNSSELLLPFNLSQRTFFGLDMRIRLPTRTAIQKSFPVSVSLISNSITGQQSAPLSSNAAWTLILYFEVRHSHLFM